MNIHLFYDAAGVIRQWAVAPDDDQYCPPGLTLLTLPPETPFDIDVQMIADGALVPRVFTLVENKSAKATAAASYFSNLFFLPNGFTFGGKLFQLDDASRANISAGVNDALTTLSDPTHYPFQIPYWVAADNSHMALSGPDDMIAFGRACLAYFQGCRVRFRAIKDAIVAAVDQAALDAIDVTAGYPTPVG